MLLLMILNCICYKLCSAASQNAYECVGRDTKGNISDVFQCIFIEGLRMSIENSEYKNSRFVSQDENLRYPRFEAEVLVYHHEI
jgi:hypothetical protein